MIKPWSKISSTTARSSFGLGQSSNAGPTVQSAVGTYCSGILLLRRCFKYFSDFIKTKNDHWHLKGVTTLNPPTAFSGVGEGDYIEIANLQPGAGTFLCYNSLIYDWWSLIIYLPTSHQVLAHSCLFPGVPTLRFLNNFFLALQNFWGYSSSGLFLPFLPNFQTSDFKVINLLPSLLISMPLFQRLV